jgi:large subunit ribosomal protein L16
MEIIKYKKIHKKKKIININKTFLGSLQLGCFGLKAVTSGILTSKQIESVRRIIVRLTKRVGRIFIRIFFCHPLTSKGLLSRMGKGVGSIKT